MTTTGLIWLTTIAVFIALFIFWKQWRAFTICLFVTLLLTVLSPILGAVLVLPILIIGVAASLGCLIADDRQRQIFEKKFSETIGAKNDNEEEQQQ